VDAAESLSDLLLMEGYETQVAYSGEKALEHMETFKPQVVCTDIDMPYLNGYEFIKTLRERGVMGSGYRPYIIATTGLGQPVDRKNTREAGFDEHLVKPVNENRLLEILAFVAKGQIGR
jgi:CheY-like chemotaxis protein